MAPRSTLVAFALLAALAALAAGQSQCIHYEPNRHNGPCGGGAACTADRFCSTREGVCLPRLEAGADCTREQGGCVQGARCKGTAANKVCVANVGAGGDCSTSSFNTLPVCGDLLACIGSVCTGGSIFDTCLRNEDCASEICQDNECKPKPKAAACSSAYVGRASQCELDSTCSQLSNTCVARGATGSFCQRDTDCEARHSCLAAEDSGSSGNGTCVEWMSLKAGERCTSGDQCEDTLRCHNNRCAAKRSVFCASNSGCSIDEVCFCGGAEHRSGMGTCVPYKCINAMEAFVLCREEHCGGDTSQSPSDFLYEGSCMQRFCLGEWEAALECSGAASLFASILAALGIAMFVSKATSA